jgi:hypothetical protein
MPDEPPIVATLLEPDADLPEVPHHPAPWQLQGSAYVFAVRMPEDVLERAAFAPESLSGKRRGSTSYVLYVDYQAAPCGPYRELLIAPAVYAFGAGRHPSVTRIYVSSYASVVNGRHNWGLPKDRADFEVEREGKVEHVRVLRDGHVFADMRFRAFGLALPVASWLLPQGLCTLVQHFRDKTFRFTLSAKGSVRVGQLVDWTFDPSFFPDLARGKVVAGACFPRFEMTFPVATVEHGLR